VGIPAETLQAELTVTAIRFEGNSLFQSADLENALAGEAGWQEQVLTFGELLQLADAVADRYRQAGYSTSGAVVRIPETTRQSGRGEVVIQVIEGVVEAVQISGTRRLHSTYVRARLPVTEGEPLNVSRLQEGLQLLQLDPLIQRVNAELTAGSGIGSSALAVQVEEAPSFSLPVRLDNSRSPSIGSFQRQVVLREGNLSGWGDRILLGYSNTDGSDVIDFSYQIPLNPNNGTLGISASQSWNDVIEPPFFDIDGDGKGPDIESQSTQIEVSYRQPLIRSIQGNQFQEFAIGVSGSYRNNQSFLFGEPFRFSLSSDIDGTTRVSALRFFQDYTLQDAEQVLALRSQFNLGVDALGATIQAPIEGVDELADSRFFSWQGQAQWVRRLGPETTLLLRGNLQFADQPLLSSEQFSLGGINTVRGYRQDQVLTDNGLFASAEVRLPILRVPELQGTLQLAPFVDFGTGWNSGSQSTPETNTLAAVGFGLQWQQGDRSQLSARLDVGFPLVSVDARGNTWQEQGIYFSIFLNPF
jgi:hemolysin activation/secretion protein